jgi:hypothetical protein
MKAKGAKSVYLMTLVAVVIIAATMTNEAI